MPVKELDKLTLADLWKEVKDEESLWGDLKEEGRRILKVMLEGVMVEEMKTHLNCSFYERSKESVNIGLKFLIFSSLKFPSFGQKRDFLLIWHKSGFTI